MWIDRGLSKDFATSDERLSQHMFHKESQNNPGMMVSGIVNMRDGPLGSLHIVAPGCTINTNAWSDVMTQHVIPRMRGHRQIFMHPGQRALSCKCPNQGVERRKHATHVR